MVTTVQTTKKEGNVANKVKEILKSVKAVVYELL
jgi:4-hydroxy-2-oxoheptanedioate aldolase